MESSLMNLNLVEIFNVIFTLENKIPCTNKLFFAN